MQKWIFALSAAFLLTGAWSRGEEPACAPEDGSIVYEIADLPDGPPTCTDWKDNCPAPRFWTTKEFLLWWFKGSPVPVPLATRGFPPASLSATTFPGTLGQPGTQVLIGGAPISTGFHGGGRITTGYWLDEDRTVGIEANYLFLDGGSGGQTIATSGLPGSANLAVPYYDVTGAAAGQHGVPGESVFVLPGPLQGAGGQPVPGFSGVMTLQTSSRLQGARLGGIWNLHEDGGLRIDALAGFNWLQLREDLTFAVQSTGLPGGFPFLAGNFFNTRDQFDTVNNFYGGRVGLRAEWQSGRVFFRGSAGISAGDVRQTAEVAGATQTSNGNLSFHTQGTGGQVLPGGIFAQPTNSGPHAADRFAVVPDCTLTVGYQLTAAARISVGYSFLLLSNVARPGDQIDRNINSTLTGLAGTARIPATGPPSPIFSFHDSSFWAQGINLGLELRY